jgi:hypothetical protein
MFQTPILLPFLVLLLRERRERLERVDLIELFAEDTPVKFPDRSLVRGIFRTVPLLFGSLKCMVSVRVNGGRLGNRGGLDPPPAKDNIDDVADAVE